MQYPGAPTDLEISKKERIPKNSNRVIYENGKDYKFQAGINERIDTSYDGKDIQETTEKDMINEKDGYYNLVTIDTEKPIHVPKDGKTSEIPSKKDTDNNNSDSGIDDEFYDSLECIEAIRRLKGQDISSTEKDDIITFQSEKTNTWDTPPAGYTDIMDPLDSNW